MTKPTLTDLLDEYQAAKAALKHNQEHGYRGLDVGAAEATLRAHTRLSERVQRAKTALNEFYGEKR
jgi:hypothetical protein